MNNPLLIFHSQGGGASGNYTLSSNGSNLTFHVDVVINEIIKLIINTSGLRNFSPGDDLNSIFIELLAEDSEDKDVVTGVMADGTHKDVTMYDVELTGSLFPGTDAHTESPIKVTLTATHRATEATGDVVVNYVPSEVTSVDFTIDFSGSYHAFDKVRFASITVTYASGRSVNILETGAPYSVTYNGNPSQTSLIGGNNDIVVTYTENGTTKSSDVITLPGVIRESVTQPSLDESVSTYTGEEIRKYFTNYDPELMEVVSGSDIQEVRFDSTREQYYVAVIDADEDYSIVIGLTDGDRYEWAVGSKTPDENGHLTFSFTVDKATYTGETISIGGVDGWTYGSLPDNPQVVITLKDGSYELHYSGIKRGESEPKDLGSTRPTDAGSWSVYATISSKNYNDFDTASVYFTISPKTVEIPSISRTYTGSQISVEDTVQIPVDYGIGSSYSIIQTDEDAENVGTYDATISLANKVNYVWNNDDSNDQKISWEITAADNRLTISFDKTQWTYLGDPGKIKYDWTTGFETSGLSTKIYSDESKLTEVDPNDFGRYDVGTYYVVVTVPDILSTDNEVNVRGTTAETSFTITKEMIEVVSISSKIYSETTSGIPGNIVADLPSLSIDGLDGEVVLQFTVNGNPVRNHADSYNVELSINSNFSFNTSQKGVSSDGRTVSLPFIINQATDNSIHFTNSDSIPSPTFGEEYIWSPQAQAKYQADGKFQYYYRETSDSEWILWGTGPTNAGTYRIKAVLEGTIDYNGCETDESHNLTFIIGQKTITTKPTIKSDVAASFVYSGKEIEVSPGSNTWDNWIDGAFELSNNVQENAGEYSLTLSVTDNYRWDASISSTSDTSVDWTILKKKIALIESESATRQVLITDVHPTIVLPADISMTDISFGSWETNLELNKQYSNTLTLHDEVFKNYEWDESQPIVDDDVSADGKVLTIRYTIVGERYSFNVTFDEKFTIDDEHLSSGMDKGSQGTIYSGAAIDVKQYFSTIETTTEGVPEDEFDLAKKQLSITYYLSDSNISIDAPSDVGHYRFTVTIPSFGNYGDSNSVFYDFYIVALKIESAVDLEDNYFEYDGSNKLLSEEFESSISVKDENGSAVTGTWTYSLDEDGFVSADQLNDWPINNGSYTIFYRVSAGSNYGTDEGSFTLYVSPKTISLTLTGDLQADYDGGIPELTGVGWNSFDEQVVLGDEVSPNLKFEDGDDTRNVGSHTIVATSTNSNYVFKIQGDSEFIVNPVDINGEMFELNRYYDYEHSCNKTYDAQSHTLLIESLKQWNPLNENDTYTLTVTTGNEGEDAKSYTIGYTIKSDNYNEYHGEVTVIIDPAKIEVNANNSNIVYGERFQSDADAGLTIKGLKEKDTLSEDLDDLFLLTTDYDPETATSMSYTISVGLKSGASISANYEIASYGSGTLTVKERPITLRIYDSQSDYGDAINFNYSITSQYGICEWDVGEVYKLSLGDDASSIPDVRNYPIIIQQDLKRSEFYEITPDYSYTSNKTNAIHTVNPKNIGVTVTLPSSSYDGHQKIVTVELNDQLIGDDVGKTPVVEYKRSDQSDEKYSCIAPEDAGEYTIRLVMSDEIQNYNFQANVSLGFTIRPAHYSISISYPEYVPEYNRTGMGLEYDLTVTASDVDLNGDNVYDDVIPEDDLERYVSVNVVYSRDGVSLGDGVLPVDAGTYGARVSITSCNPNFTDPVGFTQPGSFVIDARDVDVIWADHDDLTYTGEIIPHEGWYGFRTSDSGAPVSLDSLLSIVEGNAEFKDRGKYTFEVQLDSVTNYEIASGAQKEYEIKPATIMVSIKDNGTFGGYTFGDLSSGNLGLDAPYPELEFNGVMSGRFVSDMGSEDWISFSIDSSLIQDSDYYGTYLTATEHEGVIVLNYSGSSNYQLEGGPFTLDVEPLEVNVEIPAQEETYSGDPIEVSNRYTLEPDAQTYGQHIGIRVVHGAHGVESDKDIINVVDGGYPITIVWSNKNFAVKFTDSVLTVVKATNHWNDNDEFGIKGWTYTEYDAAVNAIDYPSSDFGEVKAYLVYPNSDKVEANKVPWSTLDADQSAYRLTFEVDMGDNWTGLGNRSVEFFVSQKGLNAYWVGDGLSDGSILFDDTEHTVTLNGYNSDIMSIGHYSDGEFDESGNTITMTESESGVYGVILTITDDNFVWDLDQTGSTSEDVFLVTWEITSLGKNSWVREPSISESWTYGESPAIDYGEPTYGKDAVQLIFYYTSGAEYGEGTPAEAGTYRAVFYVESSNWDRLEWTTIVTITPKLLPDPSTDSQVYAYMNGSEVAYDLSGLNGYNVWKDDVSVSGDRASDPGNYTLVISLKEPNNCKWVDENGNQFTDNVFISWEISNAEALSEDMFTVDVSASNWTGHPIQKSVVATNLVEGEDFVVSYSNNTNATDGQQLAVITITGIGAYEGSTLSYSFEIKQAVTDVSFYNEALKMYIEDDSFLNAIRLPSFIGESSLQYASSNPDVASVDPATGAITMNHVGTTTITVTVPGTSNYTAAEASYELTVSDTPVEVVDHVVYIRVPVTDPDDPDDPADDKPEEPAIVYQNDNTLYIILLLVLAAVCICFAAYIMYTHRKQDQGGGQR